MRGQIPGSSLITAGQNVSHYRVSSSSGLIRASFTAVAIKAEVYLGDFVRVTIDQKEFKMYHDHDAPDYTYFISVPPANELAVLEAGDFDLYIIHSGSTPGIASMGMGRQDCNFGFSSIMADVWRSGLPAPSYTRTFTDVSHLIVHHSAGSNSNSDYVQVVRDIYLFHTQVNGWSDIGYNYLVAQDGTIFSGRDPDGGAQDDVRGAHFCGANSGTMGVCVLGNYETTSPSEQSLQALQQILSFKADKNSLNPTGSDSHALGTLNTISGHRDGCSTLCPGENLYAELTGIRMGVQARLDDCLVEDLVLEFEADKTEVSLGEIVVFNNQSSGYDSYVWVFENALVDSSFFEFPGGNKYQFVGSHDVTLFGIKDTYTDTLHKEDFVNVSGPEVYPTYITTETFLRFPKEANLENPRLVDLQGQALILKRNGNGTLDLPPKLSNGLYLFTVEVTGRTIRKKILIHK